jgi:hypothetical protein
MFKYLTAVLVPITEHVCSGAVHSVTDLDVALKILFVAEKGKQKYW